MEKRKFHEMVIYLSQRLSSMLICVLFLGVWGGVALFISSKYDAHVDAE